MRFFETAVTKQAAQLGLPAASVPQAVQSLSRYRITHPQIAAQWDAEFVAAQNRRSGFSRYAPKIASLIPVIGTAVSFAMSYAQSRQAQGSQSMNERTAEDTQRARDEYRASLSTQAGVPSMDFKDFLRGAAATLITGTTSDANGISIPDYGTIIGGGIDAMRNVALPAGTVTGAAPAVGGVMQAGSVGATLLQRLGMGGALAGAVGVVRSIGGRILKFVLPSGAVVSRAAAVKLAKEVGLVAAASALGAAVTDLAEAVMQEHKHKKHRGRGITAAQLRVTGRTMRKVERMHRQIAGFARSAVHHHHKR